MNLPKILTISFTVSAFIILQIIFSWNIPLDIVYGTATNSHATTSRYILRIPNVTYYHNVPKIIWICWFQRWNENTPLLIQKVYEAWKYYNEKDGWIVVKLDYDNLRDILLPETFPYYLNRREVAIGFAAMADVVRISLLHHYGGIWVDATVFPIRSLDEWIWKYYNHKHGFWSLEWKFDKNGRQMEETQCTSWFLVGEPNSYVINRWYNETHLYWKQNPKTPVNERPYFWFFLLFDRLYNTDNKFKLIWDQTKKMTALKAHILQFKTGRNDALNNVTKYYVDHKISPIYKLSGGSKWKSFFPMNTTVGYLLNTIKYQLNSTKSF